MAEFFTIVVVLVVGFWAARRLRRSGEREAPQRSEEHAILPTASHTSEAERDEYFEIGEAFFCDTARSPDGRYLVGASDGHIDERGRHRKGACALKDARTGRIYFKATVTRANNPHVSNDGNVIVEDWKSESLSGALIAFNRSGERLWAKHFKANIDTSGLSADGRYAFVSTCNSDHDAHSGKTFLLDAASGKVLWKRDGWGDVRFDGNVLVAELEGVDGTKLYFPFDDKGRLPPDYDEAANRIREERERGQYWAVLPKVQAALKGAEPDLTRAKELLAELDGKEDEIPEPSRAKVLRFRGEIAEAEGDVARALSLWKQALELDPKVGIKRRHDALLKRATS